MSTWFLEGKLDSRELSRHSLSPLPLTIGRDTGADISVVLAGVSRIHARVEDQGGNPVLVDLQSTNGTFVNRQKITQPTRLQHGDVIHLAELEMRVLNLSEASLGDIASETVFLSQKSLSQNFPTGVRELEALLEQGALDMHVQPIFRGVGAVPYGYEVLGRGAYPGIPTSPLALFSIAESVGLASKLSSLMRTKGTEMVAARGLKGYIFLNTHPAEMHDTDSLLASLQDLRGRFPHLPLVFEVHEHAVAEVDSLRHFKQELKKIGIRFAFDDFGVGQSRLLELLEAQPEIVKFDRSLIAGLDLAETNRGNLLSRLVDFARDNDIETLAEGVETEPELKACEALGFELYQGYYFGKPTPIGDAK